MPDVVLPVLDEREALPWVLGRMPAGYVPIVVDNGSRRRLGRAGRAARRAGRARAAARLRRRVLGGARAARADVVCFMDCDASFDPRELPRVADPVARGAADLVLGARAPAPGAWPVHARAANAVLAWELRRRAGVPLRDLGPMRAARREPLLALGIARPALRLAAGDGAARRRRRAGGSTRWSSATTRGRDARR